MFYLVSSHTNSCRQPLLACRDTADTRTSVQRRTHHPTPCSRTRTTRVQSTNNTPVPRIYTNTLSTTKATDFKSRSTQLLPPPPTNSRRKRKKLSPQNCVPVTSCSHNHHHENGVGNSYCTPTNCEFAPVFVRSEKLNLGPVIREHAHPNILQKGVGSSGFTAQVASLEAGGDRSPRTLLSLGRMLLLGLSQHNSPIIINLSVNNLIPSHRRTAEEFSCLQLPP